MTTMQAIHLSGVAKKYGQEMAVEPLDLDIQPGSFVTILGPSGCGKTTLLRMIAGLEEPDEGEIRLGDTLVFSRKGGVLVPPEKRGIGLIFQSYALWPHMTVERNITLALTEQKLPANQIEERLVNALQMVQLEEFRHRYPSELSGGQQQRVAVARLIAMRSGILLMDEPLSNLDAMLRTDMRTEMKQLHKQLEATTVYVTHDQVEALTLSDKIVVMNRGVVQQHASPYEIYHHPANLFVAEFIGDPRVNLIEGRIEQSSGTSKIINLGFAQLSADIDAAQVDRIVIASIRPEAIQISLVETQGYQQATLEHSQPTGSETILFLAVDKQKLTAITPGFQAFEPGKHLWFNIESADINFFDPTSRMLLGSGGRSVRSNKAGSS